MRWKDLRRSSNVRDYRGARAGFPVRLGLGGRRGGGLGIIVLLVVVFLIGGPEALNFLLGGGTPAPSSQQASRPAGSERRGRSIRGRDSRQHRGCVDADIHGFR